MNQSAMIWGGKRDEPDDCLSQACNNTFYLEAEYSQYFYIVNWDRYNKRSFLIDIRPDNQGKLLSAVGLLMGLVFIYY